MHLVSKVIYLFSRDSLLWCFVVREAKNSQKKHLPIQKVNETVYFTAVNTSILKFVSKFVLIITIVIKIEVNFII